MGQPSGDYEFFRWSSRRNLALVGTLAALLHALLFFGEDALAQQVEYSTATVTAAQSSETVATSWEATAAPAASVPSIASAPAVEPEAAQEPVGQAAAAASASATASAPAEQEASAPASAPATESVPAEASASAQASAPAVEPAPVEPEASASASASAEAGSSAEASAPAETSAPAEASAPAAESAPAESSAPAVEPIPTEQEASAPASVPAEASAPATELAPVYEEPPADVGVVQEEPVRGEESSAEGIPQPSEEWPISGYPYEGEPCEDRHCGIENLEGPVECAIYETASGEEVYGCADPRTYEQDGCYEVTFYAQEGEPYANLNTCEGEKPYAPPEPPIYEEPPEDAGEEGGSAPAGGEEPPTGGENSQVEEKPAPSGGEEPPVGEGPVFGENAAFRRPPAEEMPESSVQAPDLGEKNVRSAPDFFLVGAADGLRVAAGDAAEAFKGAAVEVLEVFVEPILQPETGSHNSSGLALTGSFLGGWTDPSDGPPTDEPAGRDPLSVGGRSDSGSEIYSGGPSRPFFPADPPPVLPTAPVAPAGNSFALSPGGIGGGGGGGPPLTLLCALFSVPTLARRGGRLYELLFGPWKPGSALRPALERPG